MPTHESVLLKEVLEGISPQPGDILVDGTVGLGGHAKALLEAMGPNGMLIGFDKDPQAIAQSEKNLNDYKDRVVLVHEDFKNIPQYLQRRGFAQVQGILLDLGVSSMQLERSGRGFSFQTDGPLDMRMNTNQPLSAKEIVNDASREQLESILRAYGQERYARRIAERIVRFRDQKAIQSTKELEAIIFYAVPKPYRYGRIHPATRSFQAIRIAVNEELEALKSFLTRCLEYVSKDSRIAVISFHSLEDRIVKQIFRSFSEQGFGRMLTKKPIEAGEEERQKNPRSRSAKLRVFEKSG